MDSKYKNIIVGLAAALLIGTLIGLNADKLDLKRYCNFKKDTCVPGSMKDDCDITHIKREPY